MTVPAGSIVVGVNGAPAGAAAMRWAAQEARARRLPLCLVHSWDLYPTFDGSVFLVLKDVETAENQLLDDAVSQARALAPDLTVTSHLARGRADDVLVQASSGATMVVLGTHSGSTAWLGTVLGHVTARAHCPVVVVPDTDLAAAPADVVVGVDGSAVSAAAVGFGFEEASRRGGTLVAVLSVTPSFDAYVPSEPVLQDLRERGERWLGEALAGWSEKYPDLAVRTVVSLQGPLPELEKAASSAGLLVVGSHGRGAVRRFALGSVSASLLRSAPCPVAVVRADAES